MLWRRFRCPACSQTFCDQCRAIPYHTDLTCEQNRAPQCLYCRQRMMDTSDSGQARSGTTRLEMLFHSMPVSAAGTLLLPPQHASNSSAQPEQQSLSAAPGIHAATTLTESGIWQALLSLDEDGQQHDSRSARCEAAAQGHWDIRKWCLPGWLALAAIGLNIWLSRFQDLAPNCWHCCRLNVRQLRKGIGNRGVAHKWCLERLELEMLHHHLQLVRQPCAVPFNV